MSERLPVVAIGAVLRRTAFPVFAFVVPTSAVVLLRGGLGPTLATFIPLVTGVGLVALLERVIPYEPSWNRPRGDVGLDATYLGLTLLVGSLTQAIVVATASGLEGCRFGPWPGSLPLGAQVALALLVSDLGVYAIHRASHVSGGVLWRIHSVHHSADRLYWLNGVRFHPANVVYNVALKTAPLALLGANQEAIVVAGVVSGLMSFVTHANLDLRAGLLNRIFSTPEVHRWHHARDLPDANANYGGTLVVWDLLFGTWSLPARRLAAEGVGLQDGRDYPKRFMGQLVLGCCSPR